MSWLKVILLLMNIAFVAYLTLVLIATRRMRARATSAMLASLADGVGTKVAGE